MFDSCETPSAPASQVPGTRFVRYQNRYLGWVTWQELPKHAPPRASISDSCETLLTPRIRPLLGGFRSYQTCWFWAVCRSRSPSWLETVTVTQRSGLLSGEGACKSARNPPILPITTNQKPRCIFDSVQTASKGGRKHGSERGLYAIRCAVFGADAGPTMVQCGSRIDSCETGFEGV